MAGHNPGTSVQRVSVGNTVWCVTIEDPQYDGAALRRCPAILADLTQEWQAVTEAAEEA